MNASTQLIAAARLREIDPAKARFSRHGAWIRLELAGESSYEHVSIVCSFPLSEPSRFLSIRDKDNAEIGLVHDAQALDSESRRCVLEELRRRYLCPVIQRVVDVKERFGTIDWTVETDRGPRSFTTRDLRENVQRMANGRYLLTDIDGNRYDVPAIDALDSVSRALLTRNL